MAKKKLMSYTKEYLSRFRQQPALKTGAINLATSTVGESTALFHLYAPFTGCDQIRVLVLEPSVGWHDIVCCRMLTVALTTKPQYEALSYTWGDPTLGRTIIINGRPMRVGNNLESALRHLRLGHEERIIWADAVCINQVDIEERSQQVQIMNDIYRLASNVCVWLGDASSDSDMAMSFLQEVLDLRQFDRLVKTAATISSEKWQALISLMSRNWFTRRWVIQEIALAASATLHCGTAVIKWDDFSDVVDLIGTDRTLSSLWESKTIPATYLVYASKNLCRKSGYTREVEKLRSLDVLLSTLTSFKVTDPRDTVFSVLALARDVGADEQYSITVNYTSTIEDVCREFLNFSRNKSGRLDMICVPWAPMGLNYEGPSWLCSISAAAFSSLSDHRGRLNADNLVGPVSRKIYSASRDSLAKGGFIDSSGILHADGFLVRKVEVICQPATGGRVPKEWRKFATQYVVKDQPDSLGKPPEQFWRTLVGDRGPDGASPPSWYGRACEHAFKHDNASHVDTNQLINNGGSSVVAEFLKRVQSVTWNRRFGIVSQGGMGILPIDTQLGDEICILYGCSVPVVLRPLHLLESECSKAYRLVGECFIHGIMDGELMDQTEMRYEEETFHIV